MTISLDITPSGAPEQRLQISEQGAVRGTAEMGVHLSLTVSKGHPLLLSEEGDEAKWSVISTGNRGIKSFAFELDAKVVFPGGMKRFPAHTGVVIARSEYASGTPDAFLVRHFDAHGDQVERWYDEDQLTSP